MLRRRETARMVSEGRHAEKAEGGTDGERVTVC